MENLKSHDLKGIVDYLQVICEFMKKNMRESSPQKEWDFLSIDDFVLRKGIPWLKIERNHSHPQGELRECFFNAHRMALQYGYKYVEGYAAGIIPVLHAWNVNDEGIIIDTTWKDGRAYFGVELPLWYVSRVILARKKYGVLDAWEIKWPLITGEHPWPLEKSKILKMEEAKC